MNSAKIRPGHLERAAYIYVRQSTLTQVHENLESQRRQYEFADYARTLGWAQVEVVDDDLGRSGSGRTERPGFEKVVSAVCLEQVGGVFALEASRLARNNRDWHHLVDLCGLTSTLLIDGDGIYDPREFNDRLLLGLKGTMSEWELGVLRQRSQEALRQKAERGELYTIVPIGFLRTRDGRCELDPDRRIQDTLRLIFTRFEELGSVRQVLLWFREEEIEVPALEYGPFGRSVVWKLPVYSSIHKVLTNPAYGGAYAYGRTKTETGVAGGVAQKRRGIAVSQDEWAVLIPDHHEGYIAWDAYQANQKRIGENSQMKGLMSRGPTRNGRSLLAGLLRCRRCGRRLHMTYTGKDGQVVRYGCRGGAINHGVGNCIAFGGLAVDRAVEEAIFSVIEPGAINAALRIAQDTKATQGQALEVLDLKLEQARYEVERARRQYNAVDPENRLVASELERRWNQALETLGAIERERNALPGNEAPGAIDREALLQLAEELPEVWQDPSTDMRLKKQIVRTLVEEILIDVDEEASRVHMIIRWAGGQHSELSVKKRRTGQHRFTTDRTVVEIVRELAALLPDGQIARVLNRLGLKTGRGNNWNQGRVVSLRHYNKIPVYNANAAERQGLLTMEQAAAALGVSPTVVRKLLSRGILPGRQVVPHAPWIIHAKDLEESAVQEYVRAVREGRKQPRTADREQLNIIDTNT